MLSKVHFYVIIFHCLIVDCLCVHGLPRVDSLFFECPSFSRTNEKSTKLRSRRKTEYEKYDYMGGKPMLLMRRPILIDAQRNSIMVIMWNESTTCCPQIDDCTFQTSIIRRFKKRGGVCTCSVMICRQNGDRKENHIYHRITFGNSVKANSERISSHLANQTLQHLIRENSWSTFTAMVLLTLIGFFFFVHYLFRFCIEGFRLDAI